MCGIAGVFAMRDRAPAVDADQLDRVRDHMRARGPDGAGRWISPDRRVGLAHRRLAIIDLSERGAQPMHSNALSITFNGEIYNYQALRAELEALGDRFESDSDTEVILKLYARYGTDLFARLRGMYAFGLWDANSRKLLLARDPFGIKPLYYAEENGQFWFASQARALADSGVVNADPDTRAWTQFLLWGSVPEPRTCFAAIRAIPAGCWITVDANHGISVPHPHFRLAHAYSSRGSRASNEEVRTAVLDSVRHHLIADVPVGVFLSAGIDSAAVLGVARDVGATPASVTLGFAEFAGSARDETTIAAEVAQRYGCQHHVRRVDEAEFKRDLPSIMACMDQPSIDGVNTWFVAKAARELGWKVALSGLGGDELFGGYPAFRDVPLWVRWLKWAQHAPRLGEFAGRLIGRIARHPKAQGLLRYGGTWSGAYYLRRGLFMPWEVDTERPSWLPREPEAIIESLRALEIMLEPDPGSDHARVSVLETSAYMRNQLLRDSDWSSMAHSIELRVPLVDHVLCNSLGPKMPAAAPGQVKSALAFAPSTALPQSLINRPKSGFETPVGQWIRQPGDNQEPWARAWARRVLDAQSTRSVAA